ncbi:PREDICTED: large proline-rich protein bag6-B isoform X2 [Tarenaya hassleriana]|uniref:large proline-rich protein bag6-B isoform X2 n=1 Tax=Tarenaya hassleriana TaxID=28532 RepID=UPI00053C7F6E|nr:PREDICTED: large proline-rich protein bag6-B isoform X2 [Tarenaya hassleriana]
MGHNGKNEIMVHETEASECPGAMVEIKIKTLDSQTYTLRVDKCVPVPALKEQIASVTGVVSEQQRLICRGKVLKDDQLLSAYHVEDGHTLHLVVRQPIPPEGSTNNNPEADPASSAGDNQGSQRSRVVVGSFNIAEQDGAYSDLGQIVSAVLGSLGIGNVESGIEGVDTMGSLHERLSRHSGPSTARDSMGGRSDTTNATNQTSAPTTSPQPTVIPDSLTTLSEYLNRLRQQFAANGGNATNLLASGNSMGDAQEPGLPGGESRLPRPTDLADVLRSTRQLLIGEVAECLSNLSRQLEDHVNVTDPSTRRLFQSNMLQSGFLLENLGASLLELGRTTMMLRLGQTPDDAVVNAGPAVFISSTGRNPLPAHPALLGGASMGAFQAGSAQPSPFSGGSLGSAARNIEIRIRTGSWTPSSGSHQREETATQPTHGRSTPSAPGFTDLIPPTRGVSESSRNPVALVIPVLARYQQVSLGERSSSTGLDAIHQPAPESSRPQGNPGREGLLELRNRIQQILTRREQQEQQNQVANSESHNATNPSVTAVSTETSEGAQDGEAVVTDEGNFISSVLQQIMPFISQNVASSSDDAAGRDSSTSRQVASAEGRDSDGASSRRPDPPSPPDSKRPRRN